MNKYILPISRIITSLGVIAAASYRQIIGEGNAFIAAVIPSATITALGGVEEVYKKYNEDTRGEPTPLQGVVESTHFRETIVNNTRTSGIAR